MYHHAHSVFSLLILPYHVSPSSGFLQQNYLLILATSRILCIQSQNLCNKGGVPSSAEQKMFAGYWISSEILTLIFLNFHRQFILPIQIMPPLTIPYILFPFLLLSLTLYSFKDYMV